jgi:hypothetical protein
MTNSWDEMRKAKEESYFDRKNREALERMSKQHVADTARISPVSGKPMERVVIHGVVVDRCPVSGGIWLDSGELEQILEQSGASHEKGHTNWLAEFIKGLGGNAR